MKVVILAAGWGSRLRPLTDDRPKCLVEVNGISILDRQLNTMRQCNIKDHDITIVTGYRNGVIQEKLKNTDINFVFNQEFETTNMVYSLMCAEKIFSGVDDLLISYGDIIYEKQVLAEILESEEECSVVVDDGWHEYWCERCENPLDDAESLLIDAEGFLTEIGQKPDMLEKVQSQYIGLMRFRGQGLKKLLKTAGEAECRSSECRSLWRTERSYQQMYMTDLLQGMIDEGYKLKAVHIQRGWYEIDNYDDLKIAETKLKG